MIYSLKTLKKKQDKAEKNGIKVIMLGRKEDPELEAVPEVGKKYYAYDDGKIRPSREYEVVILETVSYKALPRKLKKIWQSEVISAHWLYATESDFFVKAESLEDKEPYWFCRTKDGGWFGFGKFLDCGRLDITGELYKIAHTEW